MQRSKWLSVHAQVVGLMLLVFGVGTALGADDVEVELKDGRKIKGELVSEGAAQVVVKVKGVLTPFKTEDVKNVEYISDISEQYAKRRAAISDKDYDKRYELADWAQDQYSTSKKNTGALRVALKELEAIIKENPDHFKAPILKSVVARKLADATKAPTPGPKDPTDPPPVTPPPMTPGSEKTGGAPTQLTEEQITLIKVMEVRLKEKPNVSLTRDTIEKLFEKYGETTALRAFRGKSGQARFGRLKGYEQLDLMFSARAREFYGEVGFRGDPEALKTFKTKIHLGLVVNYCGNCHGGSSPKKGLSLITQRPQLDNVYYTNFYLLHMGEAEVKGAKRYLIDRNKATDSLLLQFGLPDTVAQMPHPKAEGWRPFFIRGTGDPVYKTVEEWINNELFKPTPDYPITYELPAGMKSKEAPKEGEGEKEKPDEAAPDKAAGAGAGAATESK